MRSCTVSETTSSAMATKFKLVTLLLLWVTTLAVVSAQICPESKHYCDPDSNKFYRECMPFLDISEDDPYHKCGPGLICKDECTAPCVASTTICSCPGGAKSFYCTSSSSFVLCSGTSPNSGNSNCLHGLTCSDGNDSPCVDPAAPTLTTTASTTAATTAANTETTKEATTPTTTEKTTEKTTETATPTTTPTTTTTTSAPGLSCTEAGKFPMLHDCKSFYWCSALKTGGYLLTTDRCSQTPRVAYFDEHARVCSADIAVCGLRPNPY